MILGVSSSTKAEELNQEDIHKKFINKLSQASLPKSNSDPRFDNFFVKCSPPFVFNFNKNVPCHINEAKLNKIIFVKFGDPESNLKIR